MKMGSTSQAFLRRYPSRSAGTKSLDGKARTGKDAVDRFLHSDLLDRGFQAGTASKLSLSYCPDRTLILLSLTFSFALLHPSSFTTPTLKPLQRRLLKVLVPTALDKRVQPRALFLLLRKLQVLLRSSWARDAFIYWGALSVAFVGVVESESAISPRWNTEGGQAIGFKRCLRDPFLGVDLLFNQMSDRIRRNRLAESKVQHPSERDSVKRIPRENECLAALWSASKNRLCIGQNTHDASAGAFRNVFVASWRETSTEVPFTAWDFSY